MKAKLKIKEFRGDIPNRNECIKFINMEEFHPRQRSNTSEKTSPSHEFRLQITLKSFLLPKPTQQSDHRLKKQARKY